MERPPNNDCDDPANATYSETLQALINTPTPVIEDSETTDLNGTRT